MAHNPDRVRLVGPDLTQSARYFSASQNRDLPIADMPAPHAHNAFNSLATSLHLETIRQALFPWAQGRFPLRITETPFYLKLTPQGLALWLQSQPTIAEIADFIGQVATTLGPSAAAQAGRRVDAMSALPAVFTALWKLANDGLVLTPENVAKLATTAIAAYLAETERTNS